MRKLYLATVVLCACFAQNAKSQKEPEIKKETVHQSDPDQANPNGQAPVNGVFIMQTPQQTMPPKGMEADVSQDNSAAARGGYNSVLVGTFTIPNAITVNPSGGTYSCAGTAASMTCTVSDVSCGGGGPTVRNNRTYTWYKTATNCSGGTIVYTDANSTSLSSTYTPTITAYYYCVVSWSAQNGCSAGSLPASTCANVVINAGTSATWLTTGTTAWSTATNWSSGVVPDACTDVTIPSGGNQPTISAAAVCRNLTINSGAVLTVSQALDIWGSINNNGRFDDASYYVDLYGPSSNWGGTGTYATSGGSVNGYFRMQNNANYTLTGDPTFYQINYVSAPLPGASPSTNGSLSYGTHTLTVTGAWGCSFYNYFQSGMLNLMGGGSVDTSKSDYGTGVLWVNSSVNGFNFNLEDDYYSVWFSNSAGSTKFGSSATDVYVKQDLWVKGGTLDLSSAGANAIVVGHNFINDATFVGSTATIRMRDFNVNQVQNITSNNGTITTFNILDINNSGMGVYLQVDAKTAAAGSLKMTSGSMYLNSHRFTVMNPATTAVTHTTGLVVSETNAAVNPSIMEWDIGSTTGAHVFPFGTAGGSYIPLTFNNSGASGNISASTRPTINACAAPVGIVGSCNQPWAGASNVAIVANMNDVTGVDISIMQVIDRWWDITTTAALPIPAVTISFSYDGAENSLQYPTNTLGVQHWNGTVWDNGNNGGSGTFVSTGSTGSQSAGPHTVTAAGLRYFSPYVLVENGLVLPIELLTFTAKCDVNRVSIDWETASEQNNDHFTIEKSLDGTNFYTLKEISSLGNNSRGQKYHTDDNDELTSGDIYYRLKQTDKNGATRTYKTIFASGCAGNGGHSVAVFPNPAASAFNVSLTGKTGDQVTIAVVDIMGRESYVRGIEMQKEAETIAIDMAGELAPGVYTVITTFNEVVYKKKIVIR